MNALESYFNPKSLGVPTIPSCPTAIVAKLGYDLSRTRGIEPSLSESLRSLLRDEATKELLKLIGLYCRSLLSRARC